MTANTSLARPDAGQTAVYPVGPAARLELAFNQDEADVSKEGLDLVFTFADGGTLVLEDFYGNFGDKAQPPTLIVQGYALDGEAFLAAYDNPDLMPAAGPDTAALIMGGGLYDDSRLLGVQGVDRMEKLDFDAAAPSDTTPPAPSTDMPPLDTGTQASTAPSFTPPHTPDQPPTPPLPPTPPPINPPVTPINPLDYVARGVMYTPDHTAPPELHVGLLSVSGNSAALAGSAAPAPALTFYDDQGNQTAAPAGYSYSHGEIVFTDPTQFGTFYCVVDQGTAHAYSMQLVIPQDGTTFTSPDYNNPNTHLLWGEWHAGESSLGAAYQVHSSDLDDTLTFTSVRDDTGSPTCIMGGSIATGDGNDSISINAGSAGGSATGTMRISLDTGTGNDSISIIADAGGIGGTAIGMYSGSIRTGDGNDSISIDANAAGAGGIAHGMRYAALNVGSGDDTITISGKGTSDSYGAGNSTITILGKHHDDAPNNIDNAVTIKGESTGTGSDGGNAYGMYVSTLNMSDKASSGDGAGDGNDSITVEATSAAGNAYGMNGNGNFLNPALSTFSSILTGNGDDTISVRATGGDDAYGLNTANITMGEGKNNLDLKAEGGGLAYGMTYYSDITMGKGENSLSISSTAGANEAFGVEGYSTVTIFSEHNSGTAIDDIVTITATSLDHTAWGLSWAVLNMGDKDGSGNGDGDGNDSVSIHATGHTGLLTGNIGDAHGVNVSTVSMGNGKDTLDIYAESDSGENYGVDGSSITMGHGDDELFISAGGGAGAVNSGSNYGVAGSTITMGNGDNSITILAASAGGHAYGMGNIATGDGSSLSMGNGDNSITISATGGNGLAYGMDNSTLSAGEGNDTITVSAGTVAATSSGTAMSNSVIEAHSVQADSANNILGTRDFVTLNGKMTDSDISTGSGNDVVTINGDVSATAAHSIVLGKGDDLLWLKGASTTDMTLRGDEALTPEINTMIHAGTPAYAADNHAHLGDILALSNTGHDYASIFTAASNNDIKGFESLLVDYRGNGDEQIDIHNLLDSIATLQGEGNDLHTLIIQGEAGDTLLSQLPATLSTGTWNIDGLDGAYQYCVIKDNAGNDLHLYFQTGMAIAGPPITVDEQFLANGSYPALNQADPNAAAVAAAALSQTGSFTVDNGGEQFSVDIDAGNNQVLHLIFNADGSLATGLHESVSTAYGTLTVTDSALGLDGKVTVGYSYHLDANYLESQNANGADTVSCADHFAVTVTDAAGLAASTAVLNVNIIDDKPTALADSYKAGGPGQTVTGTVLDNDALGADGAHKEDDGSGVLIDHPVVGLAFGDTGGVSVFGDSLHTNDTAAAYYTAEGTYGTLTLYADGRYEYARNTDPMPYGVKDVFTYTIVDGDGDNATAALSISSDYVARGVLYELAEKWATTLSVDLLSVDQAGHTAQKAIDVGALPASVTVEFYDDAGNPLANPFGQVPQYDAGTGQITFAYAAGTLPAPGDYYCVIDDGAGHSYAMQIVIATTVVYNALTYSYSSSDMDAATLASDPGWQGLLYGEWQAGYGASNYNLQTNIAGSDLGDTLTFTNYSTTTIAGCGMHCSDIALGNGDDSLSVTAVYTAPGDPSRNDTNNITGIDSSTIDAGAGNDTLSLLVSNQNSRCFGITTSNIAMGDGDDSIAVSIEGNTFVQGLVTATIDMGSGNDTLDISVAATGAYGPYYIQPPQISGILSSWVDMGDGDDRVHITVANDKGDGVNVYGMGCGESDLFWSGYGSITSTLAAGAGNDSISISATNTSGDAYGMQNALVALGNFDAANPRADASGAAEANRLDIAASGSGSTYFGAPAASVAVSNSAIYGTAGNDRVSLSGSVTGTNTIDMGNGYDILAVDAATYASLAALHAQYGNNLNLPNSTDLIGADGALGGGFNHLQVYNAGADLLADLGDNTVGLDWAQVCSTIDANSFAVQSAHTDYILNAGDGTDALIHDLILTTYESHDTISVGGMDTVTVDLGRGWDMMTVSGSVEDSHIKATGAVDAHEDMKEINIYGELDHSIIDTGGGNDHVTIGSAADHHNVFDSDISTYGGDDNVTIYGDVTSDGHNTIGLGDGNDYLMITGSIANMTLDGGDNGDLYGVSNAGTGAHAFNSGLDLTDGQAHLGDILGLSSAGYNSLFGAGGEIANHTSSVQNFNSLLLDLTADSGEHQLNTLLDNFAAFHNAETATTPGAADEGALIIKGNGLESLNLTEGQTLADGNTVAHVTEVSDPAHPVEIAGVSGHFDHYVVTESDNQMHDLYIQHEIKLVTT